MILRSPGVAEQCLSHHLDLPHFPHLQHLQHLQRNTRASPPVGVAAATAAAAAAAEDATCVGAPETTLTPAEATVNTTGGGHDAVGSPAAASASGSTPSFTAGDSHAPAASGPAAAASAVKIAPEAEPAMPASEGANAPALNSAPAPAPAVNPGVNPAAKARHRTGNAGAEPDTALEAEQATAAAAAGNTADGCDPAERAAAAHSLDPPSVGDVEEKLTPRQAQVLLALAGCADVKLNLSSVKPQVSSLKRAVCVQGFGRDAEGSKLKRSGVEEGQKFLSCRFEPAKRQRRLRQQLLLVVRPWAFSSSHIGFGTLLGAKLLLERIRHALRINSATFCHPCCAARACIRLTLQGQPMN